MSHSIPKFDISQHQKYSVNNKQVKEKNSCLVQSNKSKIYDWFDKQTGTNFYGPLTEVYIQKWKYTY